MTVGELITELQRYPQDATVVKSDDLDNFHDIGQVEENTTYDAFVVVID